MSGVGNFKLEKKSQDRKYCPSKVVSACKGGGPVCSDGGSGTSPALHVSSTDKMVMFLSSKIQKME